MQYCADCHNRDEKTGGLALDTISTDDFGRDPQLWEKVVRKLRARQMPPAKQPHPAPDEIAMCKGYLWRQIDIIKPQVIIALGAPAAQTLLNTKAVLFIHDNQT